MTKYKVIDMQGTGHMAGEVFDSKDEIRDRLRSFHSIDVEGAEKMSLNDLLEIGTWEIEEIKMFCTNCGYVEAQAGPNCTECNKPLTGKIN